MAYNIPENKIFEIKSAVNIVDIVGEYVQLKKTGKNHTGLCPFHAEKTPSFTVSADKQMFYCFGCHVGGDVFSFLMQHDNISFIEAVKLVANRGGIEIISKDMPQEQRKNIEQRESIFNINMEAMNCFQRALKNKTIGRNAMDYLIKKRGMTADIIEKFNIGYAPSGWDNLVRYFLRESFPLKLAHKAGLIIPKPKGGYYDRFRDRIIFPIKDISGRVIGFGGRVMNDSLPKYLNSPETPVYDKSRSLYGLYQSKSKCRQLKTVYIVEGYFDLLALYSQGIENAAASLGTALTRQHIRVLKGYASEMILVYDSDEAGINAARRSLEVFTKEKVDARILILPKGHDPDSYLRKHGHDAFIKLASKSLSIIPFMIHSSVKKHGLSINGKLKIIAELKQPLALLDDSVARSLYIKQLSEQLNTDEMAVLEEVRKTSFGKKLKTKGHESESKIKLADTGLDSSRMEKEIIKIMLHCPAILEDIKNQNILEGFINNDLKSIGYLILDRADMPDKTDIMTCIGQDKNKQRIIASLSTCDVPYKKKECLVLINRQFDFQIKRLNKKKRIQQLSEQFDAARDKTEQNKLLKQLEQAL
ncbi:DNA primase [Candidatus Magnetomoraceae bacterium gMMP-1]